MSEVYKGRPADRQKPQSPPTPLLKTLQSTTQLRVPNIVSGLYDQKIGFHQPWHLLRIRGISAHTAADRR